MHFTRWETVVFGLTVWTLLSFGSLELLRLRDQRHQRRWSREFENQIRMRRNTHD